MHFATAEGGWQHEAAIAAAAPAKSGARPHAVFNARCSTRLRRQQTIGAMSTPLINIFLSLTLTRSLFFRPLGNIY
jgi:hypothetical protein